MLSQIYVFGPELVLQTWAAIPALKFSQYQDTPKWVLSVYFRFPVANPMLIYVWNKASSIYLEQCVKKTSLWGPQGILRLKATCADPIPCNRATEEEEHHKHVLKNDPCCTHKFCIWNHAYRRGAAKDHKQILDLCTGSTQPWLTEKTQAASVYCSLHVFMSRCIENIRMLLICHDHRHQSCGSVQLAGKPRTRTNDSSGIASPVVWCRSHNTNPATKCIRLIVSSIYLYNTVCFFGNFLGMLNDAQGLRTNMRKRGRSCIPKVSILHPSKCALHIKKC